MRKSSLAQCGFRFCNVACALCVSLPPFLSLEKFAPRTPPISMVFMSWIVLSQEPATLDIAGRTEEFLHYTVLLAFDVKKLNPPLFSWCQSQEHTQWNQSNAFCSNQKQMRCQVISPLCNPSKHTETICSLHIYPNKQAHQSKVNRLIFTQQNTFLGLGFICLNTLLKRLYRKHRASGGSCCGTSKAARCESQIHPAANLIRSMERRQFVLPLICVL